MAAAAELCLLVDKRDPSDAGKPVRLTPKRRRYRLVLSYADLYDEESERRPNLDEQQRETLLLVGTTN